MVAEQEFFVGVQDCGAGGLIKNRALLEDMSDTSTLHGILVGETIEKLADRNLAWVITNWKLEVLKRVKYASTITVRTWSRGHDPVFAYRDFEAADGKGELVAKATSVWMIVNTRRNFPQRLTGDLLEAYGTEDRANFPGFRFERFFPDNLTPRKTTFFTVMKSMIDYNHHVHNSAYLDLASEALPEDTDEQSFLNVEISFKKEILPSQRVRLDYAEGEDAKYVFVRSEDGVVLHTVIKLF